MEKVLKTFQNRLIDLSSRNRSLLLLRLASEQMIDLQDFDFIAKGGSFRIIEEMISRVQNIDLCEVADPRDEDVNAVSTKLKKILRTAKFIEQESGEKQFYVGWPFVKGAFNNGQVVRCPLLFFPVNLVPQNSRWELKVPKHAFPILNRTFLLAYSHFQEQKLSAEFLEQTLEGFDTDSLAFRTQLYQLLKESPVAINFNQDLFQNKLSKFEAYQKKDLESEAKPGELKLYSEAVLGLFAQSDSYLAPDYDFLIDKFSGEGSLEELLHRQFANDQEPLETHSRDYTYFLNKIREEHIYTPYPLDAHQENALKAVKKGNSIVVQGPPGTGKSQLITNLMADFASRGKRVLLVSQKRAALDVVYKRLEEKGLEQFAGIVHDFRADRKELYKQLAYQIDALDKYQQVNNGLDSIQLERRFLQSSRMIDQITEQLDEMKNALYDTSECGMSIKELYLTSDPEAAQVDLTQHYKYFTLETVPLFLPKLKRYLKGHNLYDEQECFWLNRKTFERYQQRDQRSIKAALVEISGYRSEGISSLETILGKSLNFEFLFFLEENLDQIVQLRALLDDYKTFTAWKEILSVSEKEIDLLWFDNWYRVFMGLFEKPGIEWTIPQEDLQKVYKEVYKGLDAKKSMLPWLKWRYFSKSSKAVQLALSKNHLGKDVKSLEILEQKINSKFNFTHQETILEQSKWLKLPENKKDTRVLDAWFETNYQAGEARVLTAKLLQLTSKMSLSQLSHPDLRKQLDEIIAYVEGFQEQLSSWSQYLSSIQIHSLFLEKGPEELKTEIDFLDQHFDEICLHDQMKMSLHEDEKGAIQKLIFSDTVNQYEDIAALFLNSIKLAWIDHIEVKFPVLRKASTMYIDELEQDLIWHIQEKLSISAEIVLMNCREQTYNSVEYNRLNNRVTYRDLQHQVTKKRKIWPIRRLFESYAQEIFQLVPCWLASPETVSALFPMESVFDLVIFDEASQCFAEKGLPAMLRGRQVVIAGDDQQLRPFDLYQPRLEIEEDELTELEVESLLDLCKNQLLNVPLKGHYRSQSFDLIAFSNKHFYQDKLYMLPAYELAKNAIPGINYIKVEGTWKHQTNPVEAERVVLLLEELSQKYPQQSIGIITFNAKQQHLIYDLIDYRNAKSEGSPIMNLAFVKNIENVQGDECDQLIFSIGYAPDDKGKLQMQFGSLNQVGGANRLNVAITRARQAIHLVTSIWPEQLQVAGAKNDGPKLLKEYLAFAKSVSEGTFSPDSSVNTEIGFGQEWFLQQRLATLLSEDEIVKTMTNYPYMDVLMWQNDHLIGGLLTDDNRYFLAGSSKDSHAYLPMLLSDKNWPYRRVFSRQYWLDKGKLTTDMLKYFTE